MYGTTAQSKSARPSVAPSRPATALGPVSAAARIGSNQTAIRRNAAGQAAPPAPAGPGVVRRACACAAAAPVRDPAEEMARSTSTGASVQRKCACGGTPGPDGECAACKAKRMAAQAGAQRKESAASAPAAGASTAAPSTAPPIVHSVIGSSGKPLDPQTRADLEPKFGQDFSGVRIHTDARAAESARAVNALAYTVGNNIVFNEGRYNPNSSDGRHLLAHELTHTIQQGAVRPSGDLPIGDTAAPEEREADDVARGVTSARAGSSGLSVRRAVLQKEDADGQTPQPDAGAATSASGKDAAKSDGIGPDEVYAYADSVLGKGWRERLMGQQDPGAEGQANQAADSVSAGGTAPEVASMRGGPELQMVHPAVIVGAAALAIVACAFPFFLYALDNYSSKGDKWMHCWASCKIGTYCGLPGIAQVVSVLVGATKEVVDALCDAAGRKCSAEWNDFVADLDGIWCTIRHPLTTCVDCCDNTALPK